jgi:hypothetical protein
MLAQTLLVIDAAINLLLGALLLWFPQGLVRALGLPVSDTLFYARLLGAVVFGIGLALTFEAWPIVGAGLGLGLVGAVAINLSAAATLAWLLAAARVEMNVGGKALLWTVVGILAALSLMEVLAL